MLDQMADVEHVSVATVDDIRQKRLAYFTVTQQQKHMMSPSEAKSRQTTEELHREEIPATQLNINNSHSRDCVTHPATQLNINNSPSRDCVTQNRNSLSAEGSQDDKRPNCWSSENVELVDKSFHRHNDVEMMGGLDAKERFNHHNHLNQELLVIKQHPMLGGFSTKDSILTIGQRNNDHTYNSNVANITGVEMNTQGFFSEKIAAEIRSVLGEEGLYNIMMNVARDLKQLNEGKPNPHLINNLNRKEMDSIREVMDRSSRSSSSSLVQNVSMRHKEWSDVSSPNPITCKTASLMSSTITRNLQQLKEGENKNITLARNYDQVTVPTTTKNSFSSEEIYRQAYGGQTVHSEKQYNGHRYPETVPYHWQDRRAFTQHSHEGSSYPNHETGHSPLSHFSPPINQNNMFSFPPPQPHVHFDPQFNTTLSFPSSPGSPTSQFVFQNTQPFYNQQYSSSSNHLPLQHCQDVKQIYAGYKPSLPPHSTTVFQQSPGSYFYPPPDPRRGVGFRHGTPVHLPPPPIPQYVKQHTYAPQHQLPASPRPEDQLGNPVLQAMPDFVLGGHFVRAPHPPHAPPALQPRIEPHVFPHRFEHRRLSDGNNNASPKQQLENGRSENYTLQRYFSSIQMYNKIKLDAGDIAVASSDNFGCELSGADDETRTAVTNVTGISTENTGGLTERLQNLDIDLDHLKHLRLVDEERSHHPASENAEVFPKRIKRCPECSCLNKDYMDWCVSCGEVLIGIEPTFHKRNDDIYSSQQNKKALKTPGPNREGNCLRNAEAMGKNMECEGKQYSGKRYSESSGDLSQSGFPGQPQLEAITSTLSRDQWRAYDDPLQKGIIKDQLQEGAYDRGEDILLLENDKETDSYIVHNDLNADNKCLEEIEDPLIREFAISYRKRQLLQQKNLGQIAPKTFNKGSRKKQFSVNNDDMQEEDMTVVDASIVAISVAATSSLATSSAESHVVKNDVVTLGNARPGATSLSGAVKIVTSTVWKKDALDIGQNLSCNHVISDLTSNYRVAPSPGPTFWPSALEKGNTTNVVVLQPFIEHVETITDGNIQSGTDQHLVNKNGNRKVEVSDEERKMSMKKKKKNKLGGETVDIEIFGYDETRKSCLQTTNRVVPVLNLKTSSDEEADDDDDNDSEIEAETIDDDVSEFLASSEFDKQLKTPNPAKSHAYNRAQSTKNHKNLSLAQASQSNPVKATHTSPPPPSFSKSGASFHHQKNRGSVFSGPARYQRHWNRSSIAWSSYNPRELSTRSSLGLSQSIPQRGVGRATVFNQVGGSQQESRGECGRSTAPPAQRRPSSAGSKQSQPAPEMHQRPSSAKVPHSREKPQVQPPATLQEDCFQSYPPRDHFQGYPRDHFQGYPRDNFQGYPPTTRGGDGFQGYPTTTSQEDSFHGYPATSSGGDGLQGYQEITFHGYPPITSHGDGFHGYPPNTSHGDGLQTHPPTTSHRYGPHIGRQDRYALISSSQKETGIRHTSRHKKASMEKDVPIQTDSSIATGSPHGEVISDKDSPRLLCAELHRLAHRDIREEHSGRPQALPMNTYHKLQKMTPRIAQGQLSQWQCLPDEIWLYIFNFLSKNQLINMMLTSKYFSRLANDETLWKYITVKPKYSMTDKSLASIAEHRPVSLAMIKCQGTQVTLEGLHHFFMETQDRLKELNICGCSQGSLVGTQVLNVASLYCRQLTHLDASFCNVKDESFIAMCHCVERFESVCLNGFQSMSDSTLLVLLKKHGKSLRTLELYACFSLSASAFLSIGHHCTSLRRLCLGSCNKLTEAAMTSLSTNLTHIEELDLRGSKNLRNDCINKIVCNCPHIHTLILANCHQISDMALAAIATNVKTRLRVLDVCGCNKVTDDGVSILANNCGHLTTLDISSTRCTGVSLQKLADSSCNNYLETVKFSFLSRLTEACLSNFIHQCPRLKSVHVFGCSSLKNMAKLQSANHRLSLEGDSHMYKS